MQTISIVISYSSVGIVVLPCWTQPYVLARWRQVSFEELTGGQDGLDGRDEQEVQSLELRPNTLASPAFNSVLRARVESWRESVVLLSRR